MINFLGNVFQTIVTDFQHNVQKLSSSVAKERGKQHREIDCQQQQIPCVYFDIGCHVNIKISNSKNFYLKNSKRF